MNAPAPHRSATALDEDEEAQRAPGPDPCIPEDKRGENGEHNDRPHVEEIERIEPATRS